jgi:hypothetical protein
MDVRERDRALGKIRTRRIDQLPRRLRPEARKIADLTKKQINVMLDLAESVRHLAPETAGGDEAFEKRIEEFRMPPEFETRRKEGAMNTDREKAELDELLKKKKP